MFAVEGKLSEECVQSLFVIATVGILSSEILYCRSMCCGEKYT